MIHPKPLQVDPDIRKASTLDTSFYNSHVYWEEATEKIFVRSWQLVHYGSSLQESNTVFPFLYHPGLLNEPLLLSRSENDEWQCMSNVCTHRGNLLVHEPGKLKKLICDYHGRRFSLAGKMEFMPEFKEVLDFPRACDHLPQLPLQCWHQFPFISLQPAFDFTEVSTVMDRYIGFLPLPQFRFAPEYSKEYTVQAHWALYCDNYLEGFHIPFVHADLNKTLDYQQYETILFEHGSLQVGVAEEGSSFFHLPAGHMHAGKKIAAYYFWLFPNMMFNFYPWGLSINVVRPVSKEQSQVSFYTYIYDEELYTQEAAANALHQVEEEDERVVQQVQRGIRSRLYQAGRFSASREQGVHHFHRLISKYMNA